MTHPPAAAPVLPTHRRVLALALPMTLANVTTPMLGFVGAAVIGGSATRPCSARWRWGL